VSAVPTGLSDLLANGGIFLFVAAVQLVELLALGAYHRWTRRGLPFQRLLPMLAAGLGLSAAALFIAFGAGPVAVGAALTVSLVAHVADLVNRVGRPGSKSSPGVQNHENRTVTTFAGS
jgi:hypothetical protein